MLWSSDQNTWRPHVFSIFFPHGKRMGWVPLAHTHTCRRPCPPPQNVMLATWSSTMYFLSHTHEKKGEKTRAVLTLHSFSFHSRRLFLLYVCLTWIVWERFHRSQRFTTWPLALPPPCRALRGALEQANADLLFHSHTIFAHTHPHTPVSITVGVKMLNCLRSYMNNECTMVCSLHVTRLTNNFELIIWNDLIHCKFRFLTHFIYLN